MPDPLRQPTPEELDAAEEIVDFTVRVCSGCGEIHFAHYNAAGKLVSVLSLSPEEFFDMSDTVADEFEELPDGAGEPVTGTAH